MSEAVTTTSADGNGGKLITFHEGGQEDKDPESLPATSSEFCQAENSLIEGARWVILSNRIVAYWPFSTRVSLTGRKYLHFHLPTLGFFLSLLYILLNFLYIITYFRERLHMEGRMEVIDVILITIWDLMVAMSVIGYRIFCIIQLPKFGFFWQEFVELVAQITIISSEKETKDKLATLRIWSLKWLVLMTLLGQSDCCSVFYKYGYLEKVDLAIVMIYSYLESVICMHNSSALMLIFIIKVITYGFTVCRRKADELALGMDLEGIGRRPRNIYLEDDAFENHKQGSGSLNLTKVLDLVERLENCVESFNRFFGLSLFIEAVLGFWQVMFALYFLATIDTVVHSVIMVVPIVIYSASLVALCVASSDLTKECVGMLGSFQKLPSGILNTDANFHIQVLQTRLSSSPPGVQVGQLFQIRESLLASALNTLATYFIVLVQMRQVATAHAKKGI